MRSLAKTSGLSRLLLFAAITLNTPVLLAEDNPPAGDAMAGQALAAKKCYRCHGNNGVSDDPDTPHLAAQNPAYLLKQMHDYKLKIREDKNMYKRVRRLSEQQMADIAAWFAWQVLPETDPELKKQTKVPEMVTKGDKQRDIPPCMLCHGVDGKTVGGEIPSLAGQSADYLIYTMQNFKDGSRANDPGGIVQGFLKKLSDTEIEALAVYFAHMGGRE
ncbi:MAG TPA: cytochrome c4 [Gammaproteobacteria bacterium]|nr:cytochrome c4 [Gammaproteobacteria bacterium]